MNDKIKCRPFIKWVGGKNQLLKNLITQIPAYNRYFEPFIGGGALFFSLQPDEAYISDINSELINTYQVVKNNVEKLIEDLKIHVHSKDYFYSIRDLDRTADFDQLTDIQRASRFIFLNKTCYNGLFRVNSKGQFNSPFGKYTDPKIVDSDNLRLCSKALNAVSIKCESFDQITDYVKENDFVYFDPPYVPITSTANFTSYSAQGFDQLMQNKLYEVCQKLDEKGAKFMLSNSSSPVVLDLYKKYKVQLIPASRAINSNTSQRGKINEVIVTNY